jgi:hypothetical protein
MADSNGNACAGPGASQRAPAVGERLTGAARAVRCGAALRRATAAARLHSCLPPACPTACPPPAKSASFRSQQPRGLTIANPTDVQTGHHEDEPVVEALPTPTATEVEASLQRELERLAREQPQPQGQGQPQQQGQQQPPHAP